MEKELEAVLLLFRKGVHRGVSQLAEPDECASMEWIFEGVRRVSSSLPFRDKDTLTSHPELLKMLMVSAPLNSSAMELLMETLLDKFKVEAG